MNQLLTCPHCGPTLTESRLRCDRCGRELVYITEAEFSGRQPAGHAPETPASTRRAGMWAGVSAAVVVVVAMAGLTMPGREAPASTRQDVPALPEPDGAEWPLFRLVGRPATGQPQQLPRQSVALAAVWNLANQAEASVSK